MTNHKKILTVSAVFFLLGSLLIFASIFSLPTKTESRFVFSKNNISTLDLSLSKCNISLHTSDNSDITVVISTGGELISCKESSGELTITDSLSFSDVFSKNILKYGFTGIGGLLRGYNDGKAPTVDIYLPSGSELSSVSLRLDSSVFSSSALSCSLLLCKAEDSEISILDSGIMKTDLTSEDSQIALSYKYARNDTAITLKGDCSGVSVNKDPFTTSDANSSEKHCYVILNTDNSEISVNFSK